MDAQAEPFPVYGKSRASLSLPVHQRINHRRSFPRGGKGQLSILPFVLREQSSAQQGIVTLAGALWPAKEHSQETR